MMQAPPLIPTPVLSAETVEMDDVAEAAQFILICKRGDATAAADFLRRVLMEIDGSGLDMATLSSALGLDLIGSDPIRGHSPVQTSFGTMMPSGGPPLTPVANRLLSPIQFFNDEMDAQWCNLVVLIPGELHIVGHVIGKGGAEVMRIEQESGATVKIESHSPKPMLGVASERTVIVSGPITSCVRAQRLLDRRIRARLENDGISREVLRLVVPNEFVRHLIGKSGANISLLQANTGVRIQVQAESTHPMGRSVTLQGIEHGRSMAQYLIARQMAEGPYREWPNNLNVPSFAPPPAAPNAPATVGWPPMAAAAALDHLGAAAGSLQQQQQQQQVRPMVASAVPFFPSAPTAPPQPSLPQPPSSNGAAAGKAPGAAWESAQDAAQDLSAASPAAAVATDGGGFSIQLTVPHATVAYLIGRGGSVVGEIEQKSGAKIKIAKPAASREEADANGRVVVIQGTPLAVRAAQRLVQVRIDAFLSEGQGAQPGGGAALQATQPVVSTG